MRIQQSTLEGRHRFLVYYFVPYQVGIDRVDSERNQKGAPPDTEKKRRLALSRRAETNTNMQTQICKHKYTSPNDGETKQNIYGHIIHTHSIHIHKRACPTPKRKPRDDNPGWVSQSITSHICLIRVSPTPRSEAATKSTPSGQPSNTFRGVAKNSGPNTPRNNASTTPMITCVEQNRPSVKRCCGASSQIIPCATERRELTVYCSPTRQHAEQSRTPNYVLLASKTKKRSVRVFHKKMRGMTHLSSDPPTINDICTVKQISSAGGQSRC